VAAPLFRLLQKYKEFVWAEECQAACQAAFQALQGLLSKAPVLSPPDPALPFILDTDASSIGTGDVLAQEGPEGEQVVAYYSRTFNKAERRYCITRRELLAIVRAVRHFKCYLCGLPFTVRTDHSALQWLMSFKEPEEKVARWIEEQGHTMLMQMPSPDALAARTAAVTVSGGRAARRSCSAKRRAALRWRWSVMNSRRLTRRGGDGSRRRTQTFNQCAGGWSYSSGLHGKKWPFSPRSPKDCGPSSGRCSCVMAMGEVRWQVVVPRGCGLRTLRGD